LALSRDDVETVRAALIAHVQGVPELRRRSPGCLYRFCLLLSALLMVLLPLLYMGMIAGVGFGLFCWGVEEQGALKGGFLPAAFYLTPIVAGAILAFFMLKPFLAKRASEVEPYVLQRADEAFLFAFVAEIARIVGAPPPREILLNTDVNASAAFRRGISSIFSLRQDLTLTIGLPLLRGLPLHELAGVLAHEFGHFTQGGGMRLSFVVRRISGWLAEAVYRRDI
jgi:Zn-dependent protease with chaperone function